MGAYIYLGSDSHLTSSGVYRERLLRDIITLGTILLASEGVYRARRASTYVDFSPLVPVGTRIVSVALSVLTVLDISASQSR